MVQHITEGVNITVETFYQSAQSNPLSSEYIFAYRITIENLGPVAVKLLRRHWHIADSNGTFREVEGEGVVGQQPIIEPGGHSACNLRTDIGKMWGTYQMENLYNKSLFEVKIPEFLMTAPFKMN